MGVLRQITAQELPGYIRELRASRKHLANAIVHITRTHGFELQTYNLLDAAFLAVLREECKALRLLEYCGTQEKFLEDDWRKLQTPDSGARPKRAKV